MRLQNQQNQVIVIQCTQIQKYIFVLTGREEKMNALPLKQVSLFHKTKISHHQAQRQPRNSSHWTNRCSHSYGESMKATGRWFTQMKPGRLKWLRIQLKWYSDALLSQVTFSTFPSFPSNKYYFVLNLSN